MIPFTTLTSAAVPMDLPNIDTDRVIPARFLRKPREAGYEKFFFHDVRFNADGSEEDVPLAHVHVGHLLRVRPGEKVPVDGIVSAA